MCVGGVHHPRCGRKKWLTALRNQGELAEGWYDPSTKSKADERAASQPAHETAYSDDDREIGPDIPATFAGEKSGPAIPSLQDLDYRNGMQTLLSSYSLTNIFSPHSELLADDALAAQESTRHDRKQERKLASERLAELVPRAEAGTHERRVETKRETAALHTSFRDAKDGGAEEVGDDALMGSEGVEAFKRRQLDEQARKTERQVRREEVWRARDQERRERLEVAREKERGTMDMLKALAKQRFG
jgi:hypothetical protein